MRRPRTVLIAFLAVSLALFGCMAGDDPPEQVDAPRTGEPVRIMERIDLTDGLPPTEWRMEVAPGHADGRILARLEGAAGAPQYATSGFCFRFEGVQDDGSRYGTSGGGGCGGSGLSYSSGASRTLVDLDGADFGSGWYRFSFEAGPSVAAVLVLEMVAEY